MAFSTEKGRNWLLKALDPSMTSIEVEGIPDMSVDNVIMLKYNSQFQVSPPPNIQANQTWNCDIYLFPHPVLFGTCLKYISQWDPYDEAKYTTTSTTPAAGKFVMQKNIITDSSSATSGVVRMVERQNFLNTQIVETGNGTVYQKKCNSLKNMIDGCRIAFGAVTLIPNVSSLYDSGVMVATQQAFHTTNYDLNPGTVTPETPDAHQNHGSGMFVNGLQTDVATICSCDSNDFPTFENAVNNPQMLSTRFKNGIYMPYKIMNPQTSEFVETQNRTFFATRGVLTKVTYTKDANQHTTSDCSSVVYEPIIDQGGDSVNSTYTQPFSTAVVMDAYSEISNGLKNVCDLNYGEMQNSGLGMCGSNLMCISIRGLAQQATFSLVFRLGFECRVAAGTNYSMFKYVSPNYDEAALRSYQNVVRQSKDAYVGDLEGSPRLRQALSALIGIEPNEEPGDMPGFVGSIGV